MDRLKDFKDIANEAMQDVIVSNELKQKTLDSFKRKKSWEIKYRVVPALSLCAFLVVFSLYSLNFLKGGESTKLAKNSARHSQIALDNESKKAADVQTTSEQDKLPVTFDTAKAIYDNTQNVSKEKKEEKAVLRKQQNSNEKEHVAAKKAASMVAAAKAAAAKKAASARVAMVSPKGSEDTAVGDNAADSKDPKVLMSIMGDGSKVQPSFSKAAATTVSALQATKQFNNIEEVKKAFNGTLLTPSYVPDGAQLQGIEAGRSEIGDIGVIFMHYSYGNGYFIIRVERNVDLKDTSGYDNADINGITGYIKSEKNVNNEMSELRWIAEKSLYTIQGALSKDEIVAIARSFK